MDIKKYIDKHFEEIKRKILAVTRNNPNTDDLISDCVLALLEKGSDYHQQLLLDNKVQHYLVKMAYIQYNSSTSPFHLKYRKHNGVSLEDSHYNLSEEVEVEENVEKLSKDIKIYIGNLPFYERELATQHFIKGISQRKMSKKYNINRIHISKDINNIKKNIKVTFNRKDYRDE